MVIRRRMRLTAKQEVKAIKEESDHTRMVIRRRMRLTAKQEVI